MRRLLLICFFASATTLIFSCRKEVAEKTSCSSVVYGYSNSSATTGDTVSYFGTMDMSTGMLTPVGGTFGNWCYDNRGTYCPADNSYYVSRSMPASYMLPAFPPPSVYKIDASSGSVSTYTGGSGLRNCLRYNLHEGRFYSMWDTGLIVVSFSGSGYTTAPVNTALHPDMYSLAIDNGSGKMYYVTGDTATHYIERYDPVSSTTTVASISGPRSILGLEYSQSDGMLYALAEYVSPGYRYDFIQVAPTSGSVTTLSSLSIAVNREFYSSCIDPCTNNYVLTTPIVSSAGWGGSEVSQLNMAGAVVATYTVGTVYMGLSAH